MIGPLEIHFLGTLRSPTSWAHVTREMILALDKRGHDVSVTNCRGFLHDRKFDVPQRLGELMGKRRHTACEIAFEYPPNYYKLMAEKRAGMLVYESTVLPPHWRDAILEYLHLLFVPSRFCAQIMLDAGIPDEMIKLVPYGIRPGMFSPDVPPYPLPARKKFTFLCVAMPHKRKGLDILLEAYGAEFSARDDVCLVIKSSYSVREDRLRPWEIELDSSLEEFSSNPETPEIVYISEPLSSTMMPGVYTSCDCYIQPSRSEGFGLAILEAFACGKPAIVTGWGGHMDFCDESNAYLLDYTLVPANEAQYDNDSRDALIALPDKVHLRTLMRSVYENHDRLKEKAEGALRTAADYTWDSAAEKMEAALMALKEMP